GAPQRYILGASESAFLDAEGNTKSAWETYIGRVLALERDEDGPVPTVGQFTAHDPQTNTKIIDLYARIMATQLGLPPHYLGYTTD
ncbi:phage capsid protein, partial [Streptomyces sp. A73]|nr:phage capsid protein [Streptomyces sp. A73]